MCFCFVRFSLRVYVDSLCVRTVDVYMSVCMLTVVLQVDVYMSVCMLTVALQVDVFVVIYLSKSRRACWVAS